MIRWFRSRYSQLLEDELIRARAEIDRLRENNTWLVDQVIKLSTPAIPVQPARTARDMVKKPHEMSKSNSSAECSCGWHVHCDDPVELQQKISEHYREGIPTVKGAARKSWPQMKSILHEENIGKEY